MTGFTLAKAERETGLAPKFQHNDGATSSIHHVASAIETADLVVANARQNWQTQWLGEIGIVLSCRLTYGPSELLVLPPFQT
jgi:hypothetical protein